MLCMMWMHNCLWMTLLTPELSSSTVTPQPPTHHHTNTHHSTPHFSVGQCGGCTLCNMSTPPPPPGGHTPRWWASTVPAMMSASMRTCSARATGSSSVSTSARVWGRRPSRLGRGFGVGPPSSMGSVEMGNNWTSSVLLEHVCSFAASPYHSNIIAFCVRLCACCVSACLCACVWVWVGGDGWVSRPLELHLGKDDGRQK